MSALTYLSAAVVTQRSAAPLCQTPAEDARTLDNALQTLRDHERDWRENGRFARRSFPAGPPGDDVSFR